MNIVININNPSDIKKLIKQIKIYKIIYKNKILKLKYSKKIDKKTKYELDIIETAFNIKNKKERLMFIYDKTYEFITSNYVETNFCEFKNNQCINHRLKNKNINNGCCCNCRHLKNKRCSINSLSCKFFFCPYIRKNKKIIKVNDISFANCFFTTKQKMIINLSVLQSRDKMLNDLYKNSLILWAFSKTNTK